MRFAAAYVAAVIGAGFASGQECVQFFARYGRGAIAGLLLATCILAIGGALAFRRCVAWNVISYNHLLRILGGRYHLLFDMGYTVFLLGGIAVMLAGSGEVCQHLGLPWGGQHLTAVLVLLVLVRGTRYVLYVNSYLVPLLLTSMVAVMIRTVIKFPLVLPLPYELEGVGAGLLYGSYNLGFAIAVFSGFAKVVPSTTIACRAGIVGGITLGLLSSAMLITLWASPSPLLDTSVPMLVLAAGWSDRAAIAYAVALWLAMYTTALTNALAVARRLNATEGKGWRNTCAVIVIAALLISYLGFTYLIRTFYPLFGVLGLFLLYRLLLSPQDP